MSTLFTNAIRVPSVMVFQGNWSDCWVRTSQQYQLFRFTGRKQCLLSQTYLAHPDRYRNARNIPRSAAYTMDMAGKLVNATYDLAVAAESDYDTKWTRLPMRRPDSLLVMLRQM